LPHPAAAGPRGILSLHLNPLFASGTVALREGWVTCSSVSFRLRLQGRGGHVADPGRAVNPLLPAAVLISEAEALRRELAEEAEPLVLAFGSLHGGSAANVIPNAAEASGSLRAPSPQLLQRALDRFRKLAQAVTENVGASFQLELEEGYPPVFNDPTLTARFREAAGLVVGAARVAELDRPLATGDDVSFFHQQVPGVYWQLGCADLARGFSHPLHSPRFDFGEELLALGAAVQAHAAWELLTREGSR
jgi:amidohydrolase